MTQNFFVALVFGCLTTISSYAQSSFGNSSTVASKNSNQNSQATQNVQEKAALNPGTSTAQSPGSRQTDSGSKQNANGGQHRQRTPEQIAAHNAARQQREKRDTTVKREKHFDDDGFELFKRNFINVLWKTYPGWASSVGFHRFDSVLQIPNAETIALEKEFIEKNQKRLKAFSFDTLSPFNKADYRMIENFLANQTFQLNEFKSYEWNPASYNVGGNIDDALSYKRMSLNKRLDNISDKLKNVPAYFEAAKKNIKNPTKEHTELAISQNKGSLYMFKTVLPDSLSKSTLSETDKALFRTKLQSAQQAVEGYIGHLEKNVLPSAKRDFRIGVALYEKKFAFEVNSSYTASEMLEKADERKKVLHEEMGKIADSLWAKYKGSASKPTDNLKKIKAIIDTLSTKHCKREAFLSTIESQLPELTAFINQKQILRLDPSKPLKVRKTPGYMDGVAGASLSSPGPYDANGTSWYNVTPLDGYSPAEAESYLREYNEWVLQILNIHEAIPGHYVQAVYANASPDLIKSILGNGATIEGWACYVERMMVEQGYKSSPEMRLFYYKWNLREVCNFILDYNVHCKGWTEKEVTNLLVNEAFQQSTEAKEKYERATLSQVQLTSYFTGLTEIYELREEIRKKQGAAFNLKKFHEEFLSFGSAPVKEIAPLMFTEKPKTVSNPQSQNRGGQNRQGGQGGNRQQQSRSTNNQADIRQGQPSGPGNADVQQAQPAKK